MTIKEAYLEKLPCMKSWKSSMLMENICPSSACTPFQTLLY
jgi:hypothetical protein